jgi:hypothetical protein
VSLARLVSFAALQVAIAAPPVAAQPRPDVMPARLDVAPPSPGGIEIAAGSTVFVFFPLMGGHVSVPTPTPLRIEAGAQVMPYSVDVGEEFALVMTQLQVRVPLHRGPPGSRRSLLLGGTAFTTRDHVDTWALPHIGLSWQWQRSEHIDMRIDVQGLITGTAPIVIPLTTFSIVWHPRRGWS